MRIVYLVKTCWVSEGAGLEEPEPIVLKEDVRMLSALRSIVGSVCGYDQPRREVADGRILENGSVGNLFL